ncbi:hypothetical protein VE02_03088 [Pseudogymnoascus sp. 03VT05]|nr:hypothetical protein VE02_03088 [Pseudogymnoascus sp. 03VT05]
MAPIPSSQTPRLILYHQTHHTPSGDHVPLLPLLETPLTHLILAAIHLNGHPTTPHLTLNDHAPSHPRNETLFAELRALKRGGIKVLGMLGGAAQGSFKVLDGGEGEFERYYKLLYDFIRSENLDGLDLDVEEKMSLPGVIRLIDRLRSDFGGGFIITLAPVATALATRDPRANLSGFDYADLESERGREIAWYNAQFYCGWGDVRTPTGYLRLVMGEGGAGWDASRVVLGVVTNQGNGPGFVEMGVFAETLMGITDWLGTGWGGVMGWEYFNAVPGGTERPWEWAEMVGGLLGSTRESVVGGVDGSAEAAGEGGDATGAVDGDGEVTEKPAGFEYFTDSSDA